MFKFLKDKLKGAISKFSKDVKKETKTEEPIEEQKVEEAEEEIKKETVEEEKVLEEEKEIIEEEKELEEEKPKEAPVGQLSSESEELPKEGLEKPKVFQKGLEKLDTFQKEVQEEVKQEEEKQLEKERIEDEKKVEEIEEEKGFFKKIKEKITTKKLSYDKFDKLFSDLELILMENNIALEVIEKIKKDLQQNLVETPINRTKIEDIIKQSLKNSLEDLFKVEEINLLRKIKNEEKPFVIAFFGVNGSGKTTTIAKVANLLKENKISCVLAAADTFRAASIEQLQIHADALDLRLIKHDYGSDPAAVAFDAVRHAEAKNIDVVLIDTAGRLHSNQNLMDELKKVVKVAKPSLNIFVGESIAGNDCIEQAQKFNGAVNIDGIILTKSDIDEKGGAAISVSYITKKPIIYLGVGQEYKDLKEFESNLIVENLF